MRGLNREEIEAILPHRGRFLLLDRAEVGEDDQGRPFARGFYQVPMLAYDGHVQGRPLVRGVDMLEMMALTMALAAGTTTPEGKLPFLGAANGVRFKKPVFPGQELHTEATVTTTRGPVIKGMAKAYVGDDLVATAEEITGVLADLPENPVKALIQPVGEFDFDTQVLQADKPVVVAFDAPWCGMSGAVIEGLAQKYQQQIGFMAVDSESTPNLGRRFDVRVVPSYLLFNKGEMLGLYVGSRLERRLQDLITLS